MTPEDVRLARTAKLLRLKLGKRQRDVGAAAGVSRSRVSRAERGLIGELRVDEARRIYAAVGARAEIRVTWEGAGLDRLLDARHAALIELTTRRIQARGWTVVAEVSFNHFGDRGSIDLLAWHVPTRSLLVIEVKTELGAVEATLRTLDVKVRLAAQIAKERFGWIAATISRLLVFPEGRTARRHVADHAVSMRTVLPLDGQGVRRWLRRPEGTIGGIWFMTAAVMSRPMPRRVRPRACPSVPAN